MSSAARKLVLQPAPAQSPESASERRPKLELRRATPLDFEPLCFFFDTALRKDYFLRRGQLQDILKSPYHQVYVAEVDAVLVGVAITTRAARLVNALVHPNFRGLGIGRALVDFSGATEVRAKLDMSTGDPRGFYRSLGFESAGRAGANPRIELMRLVPPVEHTNGALAAARRGGADLNAKRKRAPGRNGRPNSARA